MRILRPDPTRPAGLSITGKVAKLITSWTCIHCYVLTRLHRFSHAIVFLRQYLDETSRSDVYVYVLTKSAMYNWTLTHIKRHPSVPKYAVPIIVLEPMKESFASYVFCAPILLPRCIECRRGLAMRILSVRPSICLSVCHTRELWRNSRKICPDFYTIRKII